LEIRLFITSDYKITSPQLQQAMRLQAILFMNIEDLREVTTMRTVLAVLVMLITISASFAQEDDQTIITNGDIGGTLFANQVVEYYFAAEANDIVTIQVERTGGTADMYLELYDPSNALLFADDDSGEGLDPLIADLPLPESGTYRIVVTRCSFCDATETARFTLTLSGASGGEVTVNNEETAAQSVSIAEGCDIGAYVERLNQAVAVVDTEDVAQVLASMEALQQTITATRAACAGLAFSSAELGNQPVIGPLEIPNGAWVVTVTTDGYYIAEVTTLAGDCDESHLFIESAGTSTNGTSKVITTAGCRMLIEISNVTEPWTLTFEQVE
jgi:hypothetical protein